MSEQLTITDLHDGAFLLLRGMRLAGTRFDGRRVQFCFENRERCAAHLLELQENPPVLVTDFVRRLQFLRKQLRLCREAQPQEKQ